MIKLLYKTVNGVVLFKRNVRMGDFANLHKELKTKAWERIVHQWGEQTMQ